MHRTKTLTRVLFTVITAAFTFGGCASRLQGAATDSGVLRFNAAWWHNANSGEQQGFINGYQDCRQPPKAAQASTADYQKAVTRALGSEKTSDPTAVTKAIEGASTALSSKDTRGGENYTERHGYLDGEWWGEFTGSWPSDIASEDKGYVEGYLECSSGPVSAQAVRRYQTAINQHYASGHHSHDKIADVLQRLLKFPGGS